MGQKRRLLTRVEAIGIIARAREAVCDASVLQDFMEDQQASTINEALLHQYSGVRNGFLSQICEALLGVRIEVTGDAEVLLPCPCCRRRTLTETYDVDAGTGYDICDYCGWEDDGTSDEQRVSGVNHGTLAEYRARITREEAMRRCDKWEG
jgi:hypothetical protein